MAMKRGGVKERPALDPERLERLALFYVGRYATTRAKLKTYLMRKVGERGWHGAAAPDLDGLVERFSNLGYVDDQSFATARAASLARRGYGGRRVDQALTAAGISETDAAQARSHARSEAWTAALRFAERKRIGPFARGEADRHAQQKALAAMLRAGHSFDTARVIVRSAPGEVPKPDDPDL